MTEQGIDIVKAIINLEIQVRIQKKMIEMAKQTNVTFNATVMDHFKTLATDEVRKKYPEASVEID